ncbi:hypothetical protein QR680_003061 [Steinernema hermaphroditum]|uniref:Eukaryotic translation initiation factor 3 subunit M n=1 Tax=Steinernema hermaphroditum TaxID=289476 RepID=A0AA39H7F0_9BILA|nr:hypothetical protein QR680_003061 [Steinernema hermaphroditum]
MHSKLQLTVLSLYKQFLRASAEHPALREHIKQSFRDAAVKYEKTDTFLIEYNLRRAQRQLDSLRNHSIAVMTEVRNMAVFAFTGEWEQVTEIRNFLNEKGADIPVNDDDQSPENISKIVSALIDKCNVLAKCSPDDAEMALNSIITLIATADESAAPSLVQRFCSQLTSDAFKGYGVLSMGGASFRVLQNLFNNFSQNGACQFITFKSLLTVASRSGLMSILDTSRDAVEGHIARWALDVNKKREFLRLLNKCLVADERTDAGAAVMIALLETYDADAASAVDDARECVRTALVDAKSFSFDHLLRLSAVKHLEKADALVFRALKLFSEGTLSDYRAFVKENPKFVDDILKADEQALVKKIRILTLMTMAATQKVIPLDVLASELEIPDDETLEEFIISAVQLNAVNAKINEKTRTLTIIAFRQRQFGRVQWEDLQQKLSNLITNLKLSHQSMKEITGEPEVVTETPAVESA